MAVCKKATKKLKIRTHSIQVVHGPKGPKKEKLIQYFLQFKRFIRDGKAV